MANRQYRGKRQVSLNIDFGVVKPEESSEASFKVNSEGVTEPKSESAIPDPVMPSAAVIPSGEEYPVTGGGLKTGSSKVLSGGKMVKDPSSAQSKKDIEDRIKDILSNPELKQNNRGTAQEYEAAKKIRAGSSKIRESLTANQAFDHIDNVHSAIESYLKSLPQAILDKAELHDKTAEQIHRLSPNHPEAIKQIEMANSLRKFMGIPEGVKNVHQLREAKEAIVNKGFNNRDLDLKVLNKLVESKTNLNRLKSDGKFVTDSPAVNHPEIRSLHNSVISINTKLNTILKPLGMASPVSSDYLTIMGSALGNLQQPKPKTKSPLSYQEPHPDGELDKDGNPLMSKPGHIWGEKPPVGLPDFNGNIAEDFTTKLVGVFKTQKDRETGGKVKVEVGKKLIKQSKDPRQREQIPLTAEGQSYLEKTFGTNHPVVARFKSATASLKKTKTEEEDPFKGTQYSEKAEKKRQANPASKFPDTSEAGTTGRQVREAALAGASMKRQEDKDLEFHKSIAFEHMIAGTEPPLATRTYIARHPDSERIKAEVTTNAKNHMDAVAAFKSGGKPSQKLRKALGAQGLRRAELQARDELKGE